MESPNNPKIIQARGVGSSGEMRRDDASHVSDGLSPVGQTKGLGCYPKTREVPGPLGVNKGGHPASSGHGNLLAGRRQYSWLTEKS